ncbi:hypothetical protein BP6252_03722 [Coleophoma cylindrospora]|uniref:Methyltransferase type 11 domain-containing protein n=1 Tax=Coleophoma cylindrospora TaxID=1849047 RepID=A0A3D8S8P6_9HELO|nr:hypothetical protein BP6252_03722 [Coleophoma cylindrospora]
MFDVSWTDPTSVTVGEHRRRKEREAGKSSQGSQGSRRSSLKSSSSGASSVTQSTSRSGWGLFGGSSSKKPSEKALGKSTARTKSSPASSGSNPPTGPPASLVLSAYNDSSVRQPQVEEEHERRGNTNIETQLDHNRRSFTGPPSTPTDSVFSNPTYRSSQTDSSWGSISEAPSKAYSNVRGHTGMTSFYQDDNTLDQLMNNASIAASDDDYSEAPDKVSQLSRVANHAPRNTSLRGRPPPRLSSPPPNRSLPEPPRPENTAMRQRLRRMEAASPKIILERLREEWDDVADDAIYNELEFEKSLWMLVGLRTLTRQASGGNSSDGRFVEPTSEPTKYLSLYESQACASLLSTYPPTGSKTHHLSLNPISSLEQASHLRTLIVTTPVSNLPYAPSSFKLINSLRLSVLLPSSSIPNLLQECHRILCTRGTLNLTVMDPLPRSSTLGPKMKAWLDDHLILKLETQFRCLKPTRLMPIWLQDAGFQAVHSSKSAANEPAKTLRITEDMLQEPTTTSFSFRAVARGEGGYGGEVAQGDKKNSERDTLASTVGRMLWKEIYGPYVSGRTWWWEDEEIIEEVSQLGTRWDISIIEAIKRG